MEIHLPKNSDTYSMQQKLSKLYQEQLVPVIDNILTQQLGNDGNSSVQINKLEVDLGCVKMDNIAYVFKEKFHDALNSAEYKRETPHSEKEKVDISTSTPLRILSHYLLTGRLPWWSEKNTKLHLEDQLDQLINKPDSKFTKLLTELPFNHTYLERFISTFREEKILQTLYLQAHFSVNDISTVKKEVIETILKSANQKDLKTPVAKIEKAFWKVIFNHITKAKSLEDLIKSCLLQLAIELNIVIPTVNNKSQNNYLPTIQHEVKKLKNKFPDNIIWQQFFQQLFAVVNNSSFYMLPAKLLKELWQLLENLESTQKISEQRLNAQALSLKNQTSIETITKTNLLSIAQHVHILQSTLNQIKPVTNTSIIEKLQSEFEDTDFITVYNSGLVIFWPFLQRFFENLDLLEDKEFRDEISRNKAISALQYLCDEDDTELFEGLLPLAKVLCGMPIDEIAEPVLLTADEKEMAKGLMESVIKRGPHWTNLSIEGFRLSYLCRQGSLRTRDGQWLLQVQKEAYDITMQKLPWSFTVVKLPWMEQVVMVEWM
ncbi:MAG: hypothetical protein MI922_02305 [Bacteroidales bacterium]|nr:hypothetical protein [Bacteroidales bacterium]